MRWCKSLCVFSLTATLLLPAFTYASVCESDGYSIVFVNGILTGRSDANASAQAISGLFDEYFRGEDLTIHVGYNPSHIGGLGDLSQSTFQAFGKSLSSYDLKTILMQLHDQIQTQKILLVGHSQGTFYTNELYDYLTTHGVPKESIAVYNIATPASFVAGGGQYITSSNDKLINAVRDAEVQGNAEIYANTYYVIGGVVASALRGNITIPQEEGWSENKYGGHGFQVYMNGAAPRMLADMQYLLGNLKASSPTTAEDGCFDAPSETLAYNAQGLVIGAADSFAGAAQQSRGVALGLIENSRGAFASVLPALAQRLSTLFGSPVDAKGQAALASVPEQEKEEQVMPVAPAPVPPPVAQEEVENIPDEYINTESEVSAEERAPDMEDTATEESTFVNRVPEPVIIPPITNPDFGGGAVVDTPVAAAPPPDTTPPDAPTPSVEECSASLSQSSCLTSATTVHVSWPSATDATTYSVVTNGVPSALTSALSETATISSNTNNTIEVVAYDASSNAATSSAISVSQVSSPLIINEVGWGGTQSAAANQWVELKNLTAQALDLSHVSLGRSGGAAIPFSGPIAAGGYVVLQRNSFKINGTAIVESFPELATGNAEKLTLLLGTSTILDQTPDAGTCANWCAGKLLATLGSNATGIGDLQVPLSMERISDSSDGSLAASWRDTDSYGPYIGPVTTSALWGTPGGANSSGLPESGVYCGTNSNLVQQNTTYTPDPAGCIYLMRFITGGGSGVNRFGALFRGDVTNSTEVNSHLLGKALAGFASDTVPSDAQAGEHFFFAMWEQRTGPAFNSDSFIFNFYFTQGASSTQNISGPPHGNYVTIPWIYQP